MRGQMLYNEELINDVINKLYELKIKTEIENRKNHKIRYVSKTSAYNDLIKLLEDMKEVFKNE